MTRPFEAKIYCGLRIGYSEQQHTVQNAEDICQRYVDDIGWCVTVTPTRYIYKNGNEDGVIVGVIYYPRFPLCDIDLTKMTLQLADLLRRELGQHRVSVYFNNKVLMLED